MPEVSVTKANGVHAIPPARSASRDFQRLLDLLRESVVPPQLHEGLARYFAAGIMPGSFLLAVLSNDSASAIRRADDACRAGYGELVLWLAKHAPCESWGSDDNVRAWRMSFSVGEHCVRCKTLTTDLSLDGLCQPCVEDTGTRSQADGDR
jgi:hypothetical protein